MTESKEKNISETLNLVGYGLAKFDVALAKEFGFKSKSAFIEYLVKLGLADTVRSVFNRQDSFDPYFDNGRKGWWQRNQREHVKLFIDSLFGNENVKGFANIIRMYLQDFNDKIEVVLDNVTPITKSKVRKMKETGNEAEFYFMQNYKSVGIFENGYLEDARLWSDGYDFQIQVSNKYLLAEVKGISTNSGSFRMTEKEYKKAQELENGYFLVIVSNLINSPKMTIIKNPLNEIAFRPEPVNPKPFIEYCSPKIKW